MAFQRGLACGAILSSFFLLPGSDISRRVSAWPQDRSGIPESATKALSVGQSLWLFSLFSFPVWHGLDHPVMKFIMLLGSLPLATSRPVAKSTRNAIMNQLRQNFLGLGLAPRSYPRQEKMKMKMKAATETRAPLLPSPCAVTTLRPIMSLLTLKI